ncbi:rod shape-determining protein RodA [Paraperlucidibaca wandonensis]|jgi:rod shape determining protein RodA|uniref:Peptidoglycan glycosyltransferase MrdB n=1 Tax=Paraperlucidibaca wandonensis TaxID=1268273 RepID=A0ABW3HI66_9GAMM|nr:rod shape-determining protein RodA [Paraperlucidibaca sp.]MBQ0722374.1 rod shape-determining protein RodA [Paraperlucidibaca sp.]MBQ0841949.1 rod shape-determining protein RodA [Paraperlucidibaca sp.]|tara:strand:+ start:6528 stop:7676 length:1149 start_codon:yes stop_codon:yes gene_type:complete
MNTPQQRYARTTSNTGADFQRRIDIWGLLRLDPVLTSLLIAASLLGLIALYSASGADLTMTLKQASSFVLGFGVMLIFARITPNSYAYISPWLYGLSSILLVAVVFIGEVRMGAQRWIDIPGVTSVQPSEFLKLAMPMMIAWYLSTRPIPIRFRDLLVCIVMILVPVGLIAEQPDLGTSILVFMSGFFVLFFAGLSWRLIGGMAALAAAAAPVAWTFLHDYQRRRVITLFDPESDPLGNGWNIIQSKTAIGSGGLSGKGWLDGTQSHLHFLPEGHTDFIIAAFSEEFGFIGVIVLLTLYLAILIRAIQIATNAQTSYGRLLAGAITMSFFVYVFVNAGMVSGILPVVGVPLPFISYGGTAIITLMSGFGVLMSIQAHRKLMG